MKIIKLKDRYLLSALNISRVYLIDIILRESKKSFCYFFFFFPFFQIDLIFVISNEARLKKSNAFLYFIINFHVQN